MLDHSCQVQRAPLADRGDDLYETPAVAVHALLKAETISEGTIWEPACGRGAIASVLRAAGRRVYATDLIDYKSPNQDAARIDFLLEQQAPDFYIAAIVTNPPFKLADQFVRHSLLLAPRVYMLLRLAFYESERRAAILENGWLARVHVFSKRLPMMHHARWAGRKANSGMAFAWFVWDRQHSGPTTLHRISWT